MLLLQLTCEAPGMNLAVDEALLDAAESGLLSEDVLRIWEPRVPFVVIGRSSKVDEEVNRVACERLGIPILRRSSGGAAVVAGPGCLMYSVVLSYERYPDLRMIERAHSFVLGVVARGVQHAGCSVQLNGISDLTRDGRKVSGNSLRCRRDHLLYHGTLLYDYPLDLIAKCLGTPPRQPDYRERRKHEDFVANLPVDADSLTRGMIAAWQPMGTLEAWPEPEARRLFAERFSNPSWNLRL